MVIHKIVFAFFLIPAVSLVGQPSISEPMDFSWINIAGFTQNALNQDDFLITGIEGDSFEAGINYFGTGLSVYTCINPRNNLYEFQLGHLKKINYNPLIINNGSYNGEYFSLPETRPLGGSFIYKSGLLSFQYSHYHYPEFSHGGFHYKPEPVKILNYNLNILRGEIEFLWQNGIVLGNEEDISLFSNSSFFLDSKMILKRKFELNLMYFYNHSFLTEIKVYIENSVLSFTFFKIFNNEYGIPEWYNKVDGYIFNIRSEHYKLKIFTKENELNLRGTLEYEKKGFFLYARGQNHMIGFYLRNFKHLSPYFSVYTNRQFNLFHATLGIGKEENWLLALMVVKNNSGMSIPVDPQVLPVSIYTEGMNRDNFLIFDHSYVGMMAYLKKKDFFIYAIVLQNYRENAFEHLVLNLRISLQLSF